MKNSVKLVMWAMVWMVCVQGNALAGKTEKVTPSSVAIEVKIVLPTENQDREYLYTVNTLLGQEAVYHSNATMPYTTGGQGSGDVQFVDLGTKLRLRPIVTDGKVVLHSQIESCLNISESGDPVIKCINHTLVSLHTDATFVKTASEAYSGPEQAFDVYIKVEQ